MGSPLGDYLDDDALHLPPIASREHPDGRVYTVPSPDHGTGLRLTAMSSLGISFAAGSKMDDRDVQRLQLDDEQELDFLQLVLGTAYDQMAADGVSWVRIQRVGRYAFLYFTLGEEAADTAVTRSAEGEAPAPNRAEKRAAKKATRSPEGSSGTAPSTRRRGSTAATTSPPKD